MRINKIRLKNLNSLVGEWEIDLAAPEYQAEGIFAIIGPTGAGKSTILDALCLALYGRTPRLKRISQSENEIMSRQCGDCFAEVTFEVASGHYRSLWKQRRARGRGDGKLQPPKRELVEHSSERVLATSVQEVNEHLSRLTGMDYEQFTRSIMLAQGGFAAFLLSPADQRAPILEQITGTQIYSDISRRVHEVRVAEDDKLAQLQACLAGIKLLSAAEASTQSELLAAKIVADSKASAQAEGLKADLAWLDRSAQIAKGLMAQEQRAGAYAEKLEAWRPQEEKLKLASCALVLAGGYTQLLAARTQQVDTRKLQTKIRQQLELLVEQCGKSAQKLAGEAKALEQAQAAQQTGAVVIRKARELDHKISEQKRQSAGVAQALAELMGEQKEYANAVAVAEKSSAKLLAEQALVGAYLEEHQADQGLVESWGGICQRWAGLASKEADLRSIQADLQRCERDLAAAEEERQAQSQSSEAARKLVAAARADCLKQDGAIEQLLAGQTLVYWQEQLAKEQAREQLIDQAIDQQGSLLKLQAAIKALAGSKRAETDKAKQLESELAQAKLARTAAVQQVEHLAEKLSLLERISSLEAERKRLVAKEPCPLCGSLEHPYAGPFLPEPVRQELVQAKEQVQAVGRRVEQLGRQLVGLQRDLEYKSQMIAEKTELSVSLQAAQEILYQQLELGAAELAAARAAIKLSLPGNRQLVKAIMGHQEVLRVAQRALEAALPAQEAQAVALTAARLRVEQLATAQPQLCEKIEAQVEVILQLGQEIGQELFPYGVQERLTPESRPALERQLQARRSSWKEYSLQEQQLATRLQKIQLESRSALAVAEKLAGKLLAVREEHASAAAKLAAICAQRQQLCGDLNPDTHESQLEAVLKSARGQHHNTNLECERLQQQQRDKTQRAAELASQEAAQAAKLLAAEQAFGAEVLGSGFATLEAFLAAQLAADEREALAAQKEQIDKDGIELAAQKAMLLKDLRECKAAARTELGRAQVAGGLDELGRELRGLREEIGALRQTLSNDSAQRAAHSAQFAAIEAQNRECLCWHNLHDLIGSADGKKFRNFAQGITLDVLIGHANCQLCKMSDRYLLERDLREPLALQVIDNYQAGEVRSAKNLSGGESFIISLALALGLSQMAGRKERVDSLFLDEGFGSLDEGALETALSTLSGLQEDGKLIGVISHVVALKERIAVQITVKPQGGGRSIIVGPGCRKKGQKGQKEL